MTLRDRLRRWWSPAQWEDDHPAERKHREQPNKNAIGRWFSQYRSDGEFDPSARIDLDRDFKKQR